MALEFAGAATPLGPNDIAAAAKAWGVEAAAVQAVCHVESAGGGFLADKRPKILFESHQFHALTRGAYDRSHPEISTPSWVHNYGADGAHQYDRIAEALPLNRDDALEAASWGMFQIMGSNFAACGFASVEAYVAAMAVSEAAHLDAFGKFCQHGNLIRFLSAHNWSAFALHYNGPGQIQTYAAALENAYARALRGAPPAVAQRLPGRPNVAVTTQATIHPVAAKPVAPPVSDDGEAAAEALMSAELKAAA